MLLIFFLSQVVPAATDGEQAGSVNRVSLDREHVRPRLRRPVSGRNNHGHGEMGSVCVAAYTEPKVRHSACWSLAWHRCLSPETFCS